MDRERRTASCQHTLFRATPATIRTARAAVRLPDGRERCVDVWRVFQAACAVSAGDTKSR